MMQFNLTNLAIGACLVFLIFNSKLVNGKKKKVQKVEKESESGEIDEWVPPEEQKKEKRSRHKHHKSTTPLQIDFRGLVRESLAYNVALADTSKNSVCSPISAVLPLGKLVLGASGKTESELLLAIGHSRDEMVTELKLLIESLKQLPGVTLTVASKIYISQQAHLDPQFAKASKHIFHSTVEKADFEDPVETVRTINNWVKSHTNGLIPKLLQPSDVPKSPSLILVNAVYFQGNWVTPFKSAGTGTFYSPMGTRKVPMMTVAGSFGYVKDESLNVEILEIPYLNKNASFLIVLPVDKNGLPMLLTALKLAPKLLNKALKGLTTEYMKVTIPKFKVNSKIDLKEPFKKFGVTKLFHKNGDLNRILSQQSVHVSTAIQQAVLEVTETGTEAAAATANIFATAGGGKLETFNANHPFMFYVLFRTQQLFAGSYNGPS
ncbi:antichymotrypsin-2-like isoform X2 [Plodia interpunctella]|uniref:antichymotrypsin-2-like isoform X2 n=1 Tax=Plodia interpunctella TaxID=58824 RepID=UPI0023681AE4|nr:antichymotrypsin-2-like isoform X2 [Plodia interpunctella]